nr:transglycosylase [Serratia liquefaciens]
MPPSANPGTGRGLAEYKNLPKTIGAVVSSGKASLHELDTVYGLEDLWRLLEVITVDNYNAKILNNSKEER